MIELQVATRKVSGKKNRSLLAKAIVPGGICRNKAETIMIQADQIATIPLTKVSGSEIVKVTVDGKDSFNTVLTQLYVNPLSNKVESFSLTELTPESHVTVSVPIVTTGVSPAVKNNLGVLVNNLPALKLTANLNNITEKIVVDIAKLVDVGSRVLVSELPGIENMKLASEKDRTLTVVTIRPLQKVEAFKGAQGAATEGETAEGTEATPEAK